MRPILVLLSLALVGACDDDGEKPALDGGGMQPDSDAGEPDAGDDAGPPLTVRNAWVADYFDANVDGAVSLAEVQMNTTIQTLFSADVDTDGDGSDDAMSAGVGFNAVRATLATP
jgi:hypothetical protein